MKVIGITFVLLPVVNTYSRRCNTPRVKHFEAFMLCKTPSQQLATNIRGQNHNPPSAERKLNLCLLFKRSNSVIYSPNYWPKFFTRVLLPSSTYILRSEIRDGIKKASVWTWYDHEAPKPSKVRTEVKDSCRGFTNLNL